MADTTGATDKPVKEGVGKKPKADSYTMLIVRALCSKSLINMDKVVDKVDEWKPGRDKKRIRGQANTIIGLVKNGNGAKRWKNYTWDETQFLLTDNTPQ